MVILSTGTELREPGTDLGHDSIYDGNSYLLAAAARRAGALAYRVGIVPDQPRAFLDALEDQLVRADVVVTSGGVSMGDHDVVKEALAPLGTVWFGPVAMQPGKPQGFGTVGEDDTLIFTLPGNPVSSYLSFELFVLPALRTMMGLSPVSRPEVPMRLTHAITSPPGRRQFLRATTEAGHGRVTPVGGPGSHLVGDLATADALVVVPRGRHRAARRGRGGRHPPRQRPRGRPLMAEQPGGDRLTHVDEHGAARMVDVSDKAVTARTARASGRVLVSAQVVALLRGEGVPKGDALAVARLAGIMGAKQTPSLVPLCHPLALSGVEVDLAVADDAVEIAATVRTTDRTGVEMEALTAVSVAALTVVDMVKAVDKAAVITDVRVETKSGGRSGDWVRA